ncbi:hypothetical protein FCV25MIE_35013, partial [Fagus crenata]
MGRVRILKDWNVSYPYPIQAQTQTKTLDEGQRTDVKHFRRMVALIIKKCHPDYRTQLPITFKLFFSKNFLLEHYTLQFLHPLFYGSNERLHFIHLIQEYKNKVSESYDLFNLNEEQYGIYNWIATVVDSKDGFLNEVLNHENDLQAYKAGKATTLPRFVRNLHNHPHSKMSHATMTYKIEEMFPDLCAIIVDASIRGSDSIWKKWELNGNGEKTLMNYIFTKPFGFEIPCY